MFIKDIEAMKHSSKGGGGGGSIVGFLHLFDWNAKSRKKKFSNKSDSPKKPEQKKKTDGNLPITRFHMIDEEGYGAKAPGVIARLMGLDSLPTSILIQNCSNPSFGSPSLDSCAHYVRKTPEFEQKDFRMEANTAKEQKPRAIKKFQTETLAPKSAKSIRLPHQKSSGFVSSSNPARRTEPASKMHMVRSSSSSSCSSSVPFEVKKIFETSRSPIESNAAKNLKRQSTNGSLEPKMFRVLEECVESKGKKSISLALQAKINVQERASLNLAGRKRLVNGHKEGSSSSSVLRHNNPKPNCSMDQKNLTSKSQTRKPVSQKNSSKISGNSRAYNENRIPDSTTNETVNRRKRSIEDGDLDGVQDRTDRTGNAVQSNGMDVVSFTFNVPFARSMPNPMISMAKNGVLSENRGKKAAFLSCNVTKTDALGTLLDQKLRELTASVFQDSLSACRPIFEDETSRERINSGVSSNDHMRLIRKQSKPQRVEESSESSSNLDGRYLSPVSVLEPESCGSLDTADSNKSASGCKKSDASFSSESLMDVDTEPSDLGSSTSTKPVITGSTRCEPDYIKEVLSDIESMFDDFALGRTQKIISPCLFERIEAERPVLEKHMLTRRAVFDCVSECMDSRCRVWARGLADVRRKDRLAEDVYREILGWEEMKNCMVDEVIDKDMSCDRYGKWLDFDVEVFGLGVEIECQLLGSLIDEVVADTLVL